MKKKKAHRVLRHTFFFFALIDDSKLAFYNTVREDSS